jgi:uncharacterized protein with von Willebrand factor type A (vWA) domain
LPVNRDELLKLLDLGGAEAALSSDELTITANPPPQAAGVHLTALELDEWALRRGRDVLKDSERLHDLGLDENAIADFHGCGFEPEPRLAGDCVDPQRQEFIEQLLETPDYQALHATTMLHEAASAIAAVSFAEQFAALRKESTESKDALDREMETLRAVGRAVAEATEEVGEAREAVAALGLDPGAPGSNDPKAIAELYKRVRSHPTLRRICALADRFRRVAQSRQRRKAAHGLDDVVGVVMDGDLGRLLPQELAKLALPEFEDDTLRRLVERQLMCREYRSTEPVGKGPILVSVDESGSMEGDKVHTAKALALALAWIARQQHRWCGLIAYSGNSGERLMALPPGRWNEVALMDWLEGFLGRGSSLDVPVRELPDYYRRLHAPAGQTDVILVTDALCHIPGELQARFKDWKQQVKARVISLVIESDAGDLADVSDEVHLVPALSTSEVAVERVLSI